MTGDGCPGCQGSGWDWVCLGTGYAYPETKTGVCRRCLGTGRCDLCDAPLRVADVVEAIPHPFGGPPRRVVIIDEDPSTLDLLARRFREDPRNPSVTTARTALDAFADLVEETPDVIVIEFHLGPVTSERYLPGFRSAAPDARIVIFTSDPQFAHVAGALDQGADLVLDKATTRAEDLVDIALRAPTPAQTAKVLVHSATPVPVAHGHGSSAFLIGTANGLEVWESQ